MDKDKATIAGAAAYLYIFLTKQMNRPSEASTTTVDEHKKTQKPPRTIASKAKASKSRKRNGMARVVFFLWSVTSCSLDLNNSPTSAKSWAPTKSKPKTEGELQSPGRRRKRAAAPATGTNYGYDSRRKSSGGEHALRTPPPRLDGPASPSPPLTPTSMSKMTWGRWASIRSMMSWGPSV